MDQFPGDPRVADLVIGAMIESGSSDSEVITRMTRLSHNQVVFCMQMLQATYPDLFVASKGYDSGMDLSIRPVAISRLQSFQHSGGFSAQASGILDRQFQESIRQKKQDELLDMDLYIRRDEAMGGIERANKRAVRSELIAWAGLGIALLSAIVAIIALRS